MFLLTNQQGPTVFFNAFLYLGTTSSYETTPHNYDIIIPVATGLL